MHHPRTFQNFVACRASIIGVGRYAKLNVKVRSLNSKALPCGQSLLDPPLQRNNTQDLSVRLYSSHGRRPGFFQQVFDNIKKEMSKDKEMKETLKKFREEATKLEHSEPLKMARQKFQAVESETNKGTEVLKEKFDTLKEKMQEVIEEASKTELGKKAGQISEGISKSAKDAAETISEKRQAIGKSDAFRRLSETAEAVREELNQPGSMGRVYVRPKALRKRKDVELSDRSIEPNMEATGVELHKDSKFYQSWKNFRDNNPYMNKVLDWKMRMEESDNPVIRTSRALIDTISGIIGGQRSDLSLTLTEICKIDPTFDRTQFLQDCENDIIPNILEAMITGNLEILQDWCYEAPYNVISHPIKEALKLGYRLDNKILDIENVDIILGKIMDQGPVLVVTFNSQQITCIRDSKNNVVSGHPDKVMLVSYVWVLCRDPAELNPKAAWRLLDLSASTQEQLV